VSSLASHSSVTQNVGYPFSQDARSKQQRSRPGVGSGLPVTALSVEFVAKPQEAHRVEAAIPAAIAGALKDVTGFAGCLVMISEHEARLVTVVTLWAGNDRVKRCGENVRWVRALLAPYLDRCLRVQTMVAHLPALSLIRTETNTAGECSMSEGMEAEDETVCIA
jgi:hypothetical protein